MRSRSTNLRTKVVALLASLVALWAFAAWVTVRDGFNLLGVQTLNESVSEPSETLVLQLQRERRTSLAYLGRPDEARREALGAERRRTDELAAAFRESASGWRTAVAASDTLEQRLDAAYGQLSRLGQARSEVDARSADRSSTFTTYGGVVRSIFDVYTALGLLDDPQVAEDTTALIELNRARELLSQEDALLTGVLAAGRVTEAERAQVAQIIGAQRFAADLAVSRLPAADRQRYDAMVDGAAFEKLRALEDGILQGRGSDPRLGFEAAEWDGAVAPALARWGEVVLEGGDDVVERATPVAVMVMIRLVLATGLGLLAVIASVIVSITTARTLLGQLERLREAAFTLANDRLPSVVERLGHGEEVDVATEAPPLEFGDDEVGQVGKAFNVVQETALRTAVEQAELRRNVREVFLSLARRTQALVHRQLTLLDTMERREHDAEELEDLFRVDHLATRMRRNAENLIVLSGSTPGRAWRRNVPMVDVVRGAVAEVEDYTRVNVLPLGAVSLAGRAVGDIIHLLAELIENGLSFSPPHTTVEVRGQMVANGFAIEIEDRGLGMSEDDLAAANYRIVDRSELNLANAARLGLYVVSRLTERHGVRVQLKESAYGGTTAVVLIPPDLVADPGGDGEAPERPGLPRTSAPVAVAPPADQSAARPAAPVALAELVPAPVAPPAPEADPVDGGPALPTRARPRTVPASPDAPAGEGTGLPVRPRRPVGQSALDAPTVPGGFPVTTPRPVADGVAPAAPPDPDSAAAPDTSAGPALAASPVPVQRTGSGLPVRVRQANIVPELREDPSGQQMDDDEDTIRPPEQVRRMMSSYQTGTRRGRTDAARLLGGAGETDGTEPADDTDAGGHEAT
ncbi:nitrate- and nitrite sensing domain-containing protein [Micromonospora sp. NBC_01655]|uniref:sensor histidine kinase n=1 Tax=Micromonospora sp. NBC_01655 TaxID=2975983 RepID=UPI002258D0EF|nr:nitrate- and nitrite sensing domain-containing protein [Micromonospora sp. NBC_01655]MCX4471184.1 nitrate- and nitrite sensing domain-containing protein [Micromonospora sp. NBC_01655]